MKDLLATVISNNQIAENIYKLTVKLPESAGEIKGGQFANISTGGDAHLLRRPLGIMKADGDEITLCYQIRGGGTAKLSSAKQGDRLKILLPLGNGFNLDGKKNIAVIGGGVGIFPLISVINGCCADKNFYSYVGFRNKNAVCLLDELEKSKTLKVVTDDGSFGGKGNAVQAFANDFGKLKIDAIIACGPSVMFGALKKFLDEKKTDIPCFVSLEERMGCGIGACLVCVCKKKDGENARVCKDGPVFEINEIDL